MSARLVRTSQPGVYRRGSRFVAVYRRGGRQRKESAASFAEARALKLAREAEERARVPRVGFRAFRHTCASMLVEAGASPLRLQRWMGHHSAPGCRTLSGETV